MEKKTCPFLKSKCIEKECMAWDDRDNGEFSLECKILDINCEMVCLYEQLIKIRQLLEEKWK